MKGSCFIDYLCLPLCCCSESGLQEENTKMPISITYCPNTLSNLLSKVSAALATITLSGKALLSCSTQYLKLYATLSNHIQSDHFLNSLNLFAWIILALCYESVSLLLLKKNPSIASFPLNIFYTLLPYMPWSFSSPKYLISQLLADPQESIAYTR